MLYRLFCYFFSIKKKEKYQIDHSLDDIKESSTSKMMNFDNLFRRLILTQSFVRGWGDPFHLQEIFSYRREKIGVRDECLKLVPAEKVNENTVEIIKQEIKGDQNYINARFRSPLADYLPHLVRICPVSLFFSLIIIMILLVCIDLNRFHLR